MDQNKFGSRGIINSTHFFEKAKEFQVWMLEVKGISPEANVPKNELLELFKDYAEDFNTCTLAHEKYYNLERYEAGERARAAAGGASSSSSAADAGSFDMRKEQEARKRVEQARAKEADQARMAMYYNSMDAARVQQMKSQEELLLKMQYAYRSGNIAEAQRIKDGLERDKKYAQQLQ